MAEMEESEEKEILAGDSGPERKVTPKAEKLDRQLAEAKERKALFDKEQELRGINKQMHRFQKPETSKLIIAFLLINFAVVEIFSMWIMWYLEDSSALYSLITTVLAEPIAYAVYCAKSYHGKKQEESVKLERDKMELEFGNGVSPADSGMDETADPEANESEE